jgi:hypothetical protein
MRLHLTLPELEQGWTLQNGPSERILDLKVVCGRREPIAIQPIKDHDHRIISAILPIEDALGATGSQTDVRIGFDPIWCKVFTLCAAKKDSLLAMVVQFNRGQYWVDSKGWRDSSLTLNGPGTDPKITYNAQFVLGDLLSTWPRHHLVFELMKLIQEINPHHVNPCSAKEAAPSLAHP